MKSLRLKFEEGLSRLFFKTPLARSGDPLMFRKLLAFNAKFHFRKPPFFVQKSISLSGQKMLWTHAGTVRSDVVIFYIHGGGFVAGSPETHAHMLADLAGRIGAEAVLPNYRLAPEHAFPAAYDDVCAAWTALMHSGRNPARVVIGGDSAGGNLMFALLAHICAQDGPRPLCAFALSPMVDFGFPGDSWQANAKRDSVIPTDIRKNAQSYLGGISPTDPRVSPINASFADPPPVLFHVGDHEVLRDDTLAMQNHLITQGANVLVRSWPTGQHLWHMSRGAVPEADDALQDIADFIQTQDPAVVRR